MVLEMSSKPRSTSTQITLKYVEFRSAKIAFQYTNTLSQETQHFFWVMKELVLYLFIANCAISLYTYHSILTKLRVLMFRLPQELYSIISRFGLDINSQKSMVRNTNFKTKVNKTIHKVRKSKVRINNKKLLNKNNRKTNHPKKSTVFDSCSLLFNIKSLKLLKCLKIRK